tara:strand:- start:418 stop:603 length:186 start_codon:yes stop_codon:yes gene_type:complete
MSLRAFHIFFVVSVALLFFYLSYLNYANWGNIEYMLLYIALAIATIFYGIKFYNKTKVIGE